MTEYPTETPLTKLINSMNEVIVLPHRSKATIFPTTHYIDWGPCYKNLVVCPDGIVRGERIK